MCLYEYKFTTSIEDRLIGHVNFSTYRNITVMRECTIEAPTYGACSEEARERKRHELNAPCTDYKFLLQTEH